jgi:hypothetical protein
VLLVAAALLVACGPPGGEGAAGSSEVDDVPCSQVDEELDEVRQVLAVTFGAGREGREARQTLVETVEARPDCFSREEVEMAAAYRDMLPASEAEREAIEEAEDACDDEGGHAGSGKPERSQHDTAEEVLDDPQEGRPPQGEPEEAAGGDGWVAFDFHDDGDFTGRVMVEQHDDGGWFLRRIIHCGGDGMVAE